MNQAYLKYIKTLSLEDLDKEVSYQLGCEHMNRLPKITQEEFYCLVERLAIAKGEFL